MKKDDQTAPATKGDLMQMRSEMATKDDLNKFATKDDIRELKDVLLIRFSQIDERFVQIDRNFDLISEKFKEVDRRFDYVNNGIDQVLINMVNLEKRLTPPIKDHSRQITRLKKKVGVR